jgi:hypothetical protein
MVQETNVYLDEISAMLWERTNVHGYRVPGIWEYPDLPDLQVVCKLLKQPVAEVYSG